MKKMIFAAIVAATVAGTINASAVAVSSAAQEARPLLKDFAVYVKHDINYANSDFEGSVGAGGSITTSHFLFNSRKCATCPSSFIGIIAGSEFNMSSGRIEVGPIMAPRNKIHLRNVSNPGARLAKPKLFKDSITATIEDLNSQMDSLSSQAAGITLMTSRSIMTTSGGTLIFESGNSPNVFNIQASELALASQIIFRGDDKAVFVINVLGENAGIVGTGFILGNVKPANITWNFPSATSVKVHDSGTREVAADGRAIGVPGTILAPNANVVFLNAVVTGSIFASSLNGDGCNLGTGNELLCGLPGGQVNDPEHP